MDHLAQVERGVSQSSWCEESASILDELNDVLLVELSGPFGVLLFELLSICASDPILIDVDPHHYLVS